MRTIVKISFCFLFACVGCIPDRENTDGCKPVQENTKSSQVTNTNNKEDFHPLLQGYGFDDPSGRFLHYQKQTDSTVFLEWGDSLFHRRLPDTLWKDQIHYWPVLDTVTNNYIVLTYGCGNPCWGKIVLPFDKKKDIGNYMYDYFFDASTHLVGYYDYTSDKNRFVVENVTTGKQQIIALQPVCESAFGGYCIDSVRFANRQLIIIWKTPDVFSDSVTLQKTIQTQIHL